MTGFRNAMMGAAGAAGAGGYAVDNSAVFNNNQYLLRTPGTAATSDKINTVSFWFKRGKLGTTYRLLNGRNSGGTGAYQLGIGSDDKFNFHPSITLAGEMNSTMVFRDPHAWYHVVCSLDTTQGTEADRYGFWVNGVDMRDNLTGAKPAQNLTVKLNENGVNQVIAAYQDASFMNYWDGYLAEFVVIDGQKLDADQFGEYDTNGVWRPIDVSGLTFGNNGYYLNFAASGADLGDDASGNSNDFTNNNSATQSGDSPTTNHCVWSPLTVDLNASSSLALSSGNLVVSNTASEDTNVHGSFGLSAGKWYFEVTVDTINEIFLGVSDATIASNANAKTEAGAFVLDLKNANKYNNDGGSSYGSVFSNGDVANVALDLDNGKIWIGKDGTYPNSGNPATGSNEMYSGISGTFFPFLSTQGGGTKQGTTNFGQSSFTTSAPTGFEPLNTAKLYEDAAPAIEDGSAHFQTSLWSGNSSSQTVNQSGNSTFTPDKVWIKDRNFGNIGNIFDAVRGSNKGLALDTGTEDTNANGVTLGSGSIAFTGAGDTGDINTSGRTYVGWQWKGGNGTSTPSGGSVSSTVSVNQTAGFSIVSWTGTGANATVAHGLGATPQVVWVRNRSVAGGWYVGHASAGFNYEVRLDEDGARAGSATLFNETAPTSTVFTVGTAAGTNGSTNNMIAYCWAEKPGFSKFGGYTGNGNSNGPLISLDFTPSFFIQKRIDTGSTNWHVYDTTRGGFGNNDTRLFPNLASQEYSNGEGILDIISNGVKIRDTETWFNGSGGTFIYMAFAENPFAATTPATAR